MKALRVGESRDSRRLFMRHGVRLYRSFFRENVHTHAYQRTPLGPGGATCASLLPGGRRAPRAHVLPANREQHDTRHACPHNQLRKITHVRAIEPHIAHPSGPRTHSTAVHRTDRGERRRGKAAHGTHTHANLERIHPTQRTRRGGSHACHVPGYVRVSHVFS